jgi:hypothetical protein
MVRDRIRTPDTPEERRSRVPSEVPIEIAILDQPYALLPSIHLRPIHRNTNPQFGRLTNLATHSQAVSWGACHDYPDLCANFSLPRLRSST